MTWYTHKSPLVTTIQTDYQRYGACAVLSLETAKNMMIENGYDQFLNEKDSDFTAVIYLKVGNLSGKVHSSSICEIKVVHLMSAEEGFVKVSCFHKILTEIWHRFRIKMIFRLKMMVISGLEKNILKFHNGLQNCCCPVQKNLPRKAELAWQVSRYLWRGTEDFEIKKFGPKAPFYPSQGNYLTLLLRFLPTLFLKFSVRPAVLVRQGCNKWTIH